MEKIKEMNNIIRFAFICEICENLKFIIVSNLPGFVKPNVFNVFNK